MGWFPCGCCCPPGDKVLIWNNTLPDVIVDVYEAMGVEVHSEGEFTGDLADYGVILVFFTSSDPVWWPQVSSWSGTLVLNSSVSFFGGHNSVSLWVDGKSGTTGLTINPTITGDFTKQRMAFPATDPLNNGVTRFYFGVSYRPVGGTVLYNGVFGGQPIISHNKPGNVRFIVSGGEGWANDAPQIASLDSDVSEFLENVYTQRPRPTCTPRTDHIGSTSGGVEWGFTTASLLGLGRLAGADGATVGPSFTLSGVLTDGTVGTTLQANASSQFSFTTSAAAIATHAASGTSDGVGFSTSGVLTGVGAIAGTSTLTFFGVMGPNRDMIGHSFLTFSTSGAMTGAAPATGTTSLTFEPLARLITDAPTLTSLVPFTFSTSGQLLGAAPLTATSSLTFSASLVSTAAAPITANTSLTFSTDGQLRAAAPLQGSATMTFINVGGVRAAAAATASATMTFINVGSADVTGALSGSATNTYIVLGNAKATAPLNGSATLTFINTGATRATAQATATATLTFSTSGALISRTQASGTVSLTFAAQAQLRATGRLVAMNSLTFSTSGQITGESGGETDICTNCPNGMPESIPVTIPAGFCTDCPELD